MLKGCLNVLVMIAGILKSLIQRSIKFTWDDKWHGFVSYIHMFIYQIIITLELQWLDP